jgi:hypothetical protein
MLTWMHDNRHYEKIQSQYCIDDNVMCASVWDEFYAGLFQCQNP